MTTLFFLFEKCLLSSVLWTGHWSGHGGASHRSHFKRIECEELVSWHLPATAPSGLPECSHQGHMLPGHPVAPRGSRPCYRGARHSHGYIFPPRGQPLLILRHDFHHKDKIIWHNKMVFTLVSLQICSGEFHGTDFVKCSSVWRPLHDQWHQCQSSSLWCSLLGMLSVLGPACLSRTSVRVYRLCTSRNSDAKSRPVLLW